jgi:hypothetical protein
MANAERGEVALKVKGREYTLALTFGAFCEYEALTGRSAYRLDFQSLTATDHRALIWAALQRHHRGATLADVEAMYFDAGIPAMKTALEEALRVGFPVENAEEAPAGNE